MQLSKRRGELSGCRFVRRCARLAQALAHSSHYLKIRAKLTVIRADEAKNNSIRSEMLRAAIEWQELRRCCLPDRPAYCRRARTGRSNTRLPAECRLRPLAGRPECAAARAARMLPQARAERRAFFMEN
ncbi:hypothetical protein Bamb_1257 [Burkholderia ambifaria AMMD]|uniref:Uncharacterized protein n=1 Tax=Burkholderia ambifaria (strain ATCC BAA-244 / DSM 16087 / CCUG 44356 / LMG 19182 / AMMD) TaxID=339670 RepID=Q0BGA8_BURCM|nr:hypothetical protein Bamb_1257 [Burkholderia ambifaria AMMD]